MSKPKLTDAFLIGLALINIEFFIKHNFKLSELFVLGLVDICCLALLDNQGKRVVRKIMTAIFSIAHVKFGISRSVCVWFVRFLALANAAILFLIGILTYLIKPEILAISVAIGGGIYLFWYLNWLIDKTPPIDKRIINCFAKYN